MNSGSPSLPGWWPSQPCAAARPSATPIDLLLLRRELLNPGPPTWPLRSSAYSSALQFCPCSSSDLLTFSDSTARSRSNDDLTSSRALSCVPTTSFSDRSTCALSAFVSRITTNCDSTKSRSGFNEVSPPAIDAVTTPANSSRQPFRRPASSPLLFLDLERRRRRRSTRCTPRFLSFRPPQTRSRPSPPPRPAPVVRARPPRL